MINANILIYFLKIDEKGQLNTATVNSEFRAIPAGEKRDKVKTGMEELAPRLVKAHDSCSAAKILMQSQNSSVALKYILAAHEMK